MITLDSILQMIYDKHESLERKMAEGRSRGMTQMEEFGLMSEDVATMEIYNAIMKDVIDCNKNVSNYSDWLKTA